MGTNLKTKIDSNGFATAKAVIEADTVSSLVKLLSCFPDDSSTRTRGESPFARRNLLAIPQILQLANSQELRSIVEEIIGDAAQPVRGILFDKTADANWVVPWHQDRSIAVERRIDVKGFGPWSTKAGVIHVQPPANVLLGMLTIRLHLDKCEEANGPLKVIPGSHHRILSAEQVSHAIEAGPQITCVADAGDAVLMRPLILHASSAARQTSHRRVVHLEYASTKLPGELQWHALSPLKELIPCPPLKKN